MPYQLEIGARADAQLAALDAAIGASVERKILWLAENAAAVVHRRLVGMPDDLAGLCKLRVGDLAHPLLDLSRTDSHPNLPHPTPLRSSSTSSTTKKSASFTR